MPVLAKKTLQSGTRVTIETVLLGGTATIQITYETKPSDADRNEVSRMVGAVMRSLDLRADMGEITITQRPAPQT